MLQLVPLVARKLLLEGLAGVRALIQVEGRMESGVRRLAQGRLQLQHWALGRLRRRQLRLERRGGHALP